MRVSRWAVAALAAGIALPAYLRGVAPGVLFADSGELQAVALRGGIAHPSGYPTFILVGQLAGRLLPGNPAWRMNLMTAGFGAVSAGLVGVVLIELGISPGAALAGALIYGASFTFWRDSLGCEVYTLAIALFLIATWRSVLAFRSRRLDDACAAAFFMGLAVTGSLVFGPPIVLMAALVALPLPLAGARRLGAWAVLLGCFAAGLSPYAYLLVVDPHTQATNYLRYSIELSAGQFGLTPGNFSSPLRRLMWLLFGSESHPVWYTRPPGGLARNALAGLAQLGLFELGPPGVLLAAAGAWRLARRPGAERALLLGIGAIGLVIAAGVTQIRLLTIFMIPCVLVATLLAGFGVDALIAPLARRRGAPAGIAAALLAALIVIPVPHLLRLASRSRPILGATVLEEWDPRITGLVPSMRGYDEPRRYAERVMNALPAHAMAIGKWREITALKYLQTIEGARPDVILDPWYDAHLARLARWQATRDPRDHPFVVIGPIPGLRPRLGVVDSLALGGGDYLLIRRAPIDTDGRAP